LVSIATDQRGFARTVDGNSDGSAICDIGAYEFGAPAPATPTPTAAATGTATATSVPSSTPTVSQRPCVGDCGGIGMVRINDLVLGVNIALGNQPSSACPSFEDAQGTADIAQLIMGVRNALNGCGNSA